MANYLRLEHHKFGYFRSAKRGDWLCDVIDARADFSVQELDEMKVKEEKMNVQLLALQTSLDSALQRSKVTEAELEESKRTNEAKNSEVESYKAILQATVSWLLMVGC